ncbi:cysteine desulfurase family protein [Ruminiclostridium josui]|uniref:cysteine desulfurase family protein n=1 Tax=Ruminiclostridium josui TaxID=1499 RepID=UPI0012FE9652|nr:aminotransferase class V-fold PLP-dependent enzyme [Ruminiclostridium josui]
MKEAKGYFDYAASAPAFEESIEVFKNISMFTFGNPSSNHSPGMKAREILNKSKEKFLNVLGISDATIVVTSGGSEANNLILNSMILKYPDKKILVAQDSHESCYFIKKKYPDRVDILNIDSHGQINLKDLENTLSQEYSLLCILHGNNETGVVQRELRKIIEICRNKNVLIHIDGVQTVGHIPIGIDDFKGIFYTFSSHKFGSPRGSGGIITSSPELLNSFIFGGPQEKNIRAGTENIAAFAAAASALEISINKFEQMEERLKLYCNYVKGKLTEHFPQIIFNSSDNGLPGLLSLSVPGIKGSITVTEMAMHGYAISSGSACHSSMEIPPRIIMAMGRSMKEAFGSLRISMGYYTEEDDVYSMTDALIKAISRQLKE